MKFSIATFVIQIVNFVLLSYILYRVLYRPLRNIMEKRRRLVMEDVDRAVMIALKMPMGPFGSLDVVGLDTVWRITETKAKLSGDPEIQAWADQLKRDYIDKGWLGLKSGRGFYTYPNPAWSRPGFIGGESE